MKKEVLDNLYKILGELGLTEHEKRLYILSLKSGPISVSTLAKKINVSRPNVYKIITGLEKHKLARFSQNKNYIKKFMVESPTKVAELLKNKNSQIEKTTHSFENILPSLLASYKQGDLPTKVKIIIDRKDILDVFEQVFEEAREEILFFGSSKTLNDFISMGRVEKQIRKRIRRRIKTKLLVFPDEDAKNFKNKDNQELRETRFLKNIDFFETSFYLFANKAVIWQPKTPLAVLIEDEYIVTMLASIYKTLWNTAE
jgi:sugar-specific transcriptional regulator TrmB